MYVLIFGCFVYLKRVEGERERERERERKKRERGERERERDGGGKERERGVEIGGNTIMGVWLHTCAPAYNGILCVAQCFSIPR